MKNDDLIKGQAKKAAFAIAIATFLGFSVLAFMPSVYREPLSSFLILGLITIAPVGMLGASLLGIVTYFIFKYLIRGKVIYIIVLVIGIVIAFALGVILEIGMFRQMGKTPPYENKIDTNRDGKIDKWIYDNDSSTIAEIDTDYDSKPDIRRSYKNGKLIREEEIPHNKDGSKKE